MRYRPGDSSIEIGLRLLEHDAGTVAVAVNDGCRYLLFPLTDAGNDINVGTDSQAGSVVVEQHPCDGEIQGLAVDGVSTLPAEPDRERDRVTMFAALLWCCESLHGISV